MAPDSHSFHLVKELRLSGVLFESTVSVEWMDNALVDDAASVASLAASSALAVLGLVEPRDVVPRKSFATLKAFSTFPRMWE